MADAKIKVRVTAYARIEYSQMRELTPEQFAEYERICEDAAPRDVDRLLAYFVDRFINPDDVCDSGDYEDVEIVPVDANGKDVVTTP